MPRQWQLKTWCEERAKAHLGSRSRKGEIADLWLRSGGASELSGTPFVLHAGHCHPDAPSVDHIVPGEQPLRLLTRFENGALGALTDVEALPRLEALANGIRIRTTAAKRILVSNEFLNRVQVWLI